MKKEWNDKNRSEFSIAIPLSLSDFIENETVAFIYNIAEDTLKEEGDLFPFLLKQYFLKCTSSLVADCISI